MTQRKIQRMEQTQGCILVQICGTKRGSFHPLGIRLQTLGRDPNCSIEVEQENASRCHCKIEPEGMELFVEDLNSTNGTFLNDKPIRREKLHHNDRLKIGGAVYRVISGSDLVSLYHEELYKLVVQDGLTQAASKRVFLESLNREIARAKRYSRTLSIVLLGVVNFRRINDDYGLMVGDFILRQLGILLGEQVPLDEILARVSGDQFATVLPERDASEAAQVATRIKQSVQNKTFVYAGTQIPVRVSSAVVERKEQSTPESLLTAAMQLLKKNTPTDGDSSGTTL
jgi:diguanylate cyclase (GGDEF)-like protein